MAISLAVQIPGDRIAVGMVSSANAKDDVMKNASSANVPLGFISFLLACSEVCSFRANRGRMSQMVFIVALLHGGLSDGNV